MVKPNQFIILMLLLLMMLNIKEVQSNFCFNNETLYTNHNISILNIMCVNNYSSDTLIPDIKIRLARNPYCMRENQQVDLQIKESLINNLTWVTFLGVPACKFHTLNLTYNIITGILEKTFTHFIIKSNLDLSYNKIVSQNIQRGAFDSLSELKNLNLSHNQLLTVDLNMFTGLGSLEKLYLSYNLIKYIKNGGFQTLTNLQELHIDNNRLGNVTNNVFSGLEKLKRLYLQQNDLSTIRYEFFSQMRELNLLELSNNQILFLERETFAKIPSLQKLYLTYNNISNIEPESFLGLQNLNTLQLNNNNLQNLGENVFVGLKNLELLDLSDNAIILNSSETFNGLVNLRNLTMSNNQIRKVPLGTFKNFPLLENLLLSNNDLSELPIGTFSNLRNLKYLNISSNDFSVLNESEIFPLRNLKVLDLDNNRFTHFNYYSLLSYAPHLNFISINNNNWTCTFLITMLEVFRSRNVDYVSDRTSSYTEKNIDGIFCTESYTFNSTHLDKNMTFSSITKLNNYENAGTLIPSVKNISDGLNQLLPQQIKKNRGITMGGGKNTEIDGIYDTDTNLREKTNTLTILSIFNVVGLVCLVVLIIFIVIYKQYKQYFENNRQNNMMPTSSSEIELLEASP